MALPIAGETFLYNGIRDTVSSPSTNTTGFMRNHQVKGADGKWYMLTYDEGTQNILLYRLDKANITRTLVQTLTPSQNSSKIATASGLSSGACNPVGTLGDTGYMLWVWPNAGTGFSTFSLWKVNSSGQFQCYAALQFNTLGSPGLYPGGIVSVDITGTKSNSDPIVFMTYPWSADPGYYNFRAIRLPSITAFTGTYNGSQSAYYEYQNQMVAMDNGGDYFTALSASSTRVSNWVGWFLPTASGGTKWYFYVGPGEVANSLGHSTFIYNTSLTYGGQFVGYVNIGNPATFSPSTTWAPTSTTRVVSMTSFVNPDGASPFFPCNLYNADGSTYDSTSQGDYALAPTVQKLASGKYMVIFASLMSNSPNIQYGTLDSYLVARYIAFEYDPATEIHTLVSRRSFRPCLFSDAGIGSTNNFYRREVSVHYDEATKNFFYYLTVHDNSAGSSSWNRDMWGMVGPTYTYIPTGAPCFLEELDTAYADFIARYP